MEPCVYHVSETPGIKQFVPMKYWHINYERSGRLSAGSELPANAQVMTCFYASTKEYAPFYFLPKRCRRLYVSRRNNTGSFDRIAQWFQPLESDHVLILEEQEHSALLTHEFSVYWFDSEGFKRLPNGEFVAYEVVSPLKEVRHSNALWHLHRAGWQVEFVEDLSETRRVLSAARLTIDSEGI
jgi:hypothetical protein